MADSIDTAVASNGFDPEALAEFVRRIERLQADLDQEAHEYKERCQPIREDMVAVKREAHDSGIGKQELAAVIRKRRYEWKAEHAGDSLDLPQRAFYQEYLESLERLAVQVGPLGEAALEHARAGA